VSAEILIRQKSFHNCKQLISILNASIINIVVTQSTETGFSVESI